MNLGVIYVRAALVILGAGILFGTALTGASLLVRRKKVRASSLFFGTLMVGLPLGGVGLAALHHPLFRQWHRLQNSVVPAEGCLTYEPSFWQFRASYSMDRQSFDRWVTSHPWGLKRREPDTIFVSRDGPHFGLASCEAIYESPRGDKGNNLRVYFQNGIVYVAYFAM